MRFRVTYRPELRRDPELAEADAVSAEGATHLVLRRALLVVGQPREVVVLRLRTADVLSVDVVPSDGSSE